MCRAIKGNVLTIRGRATVMQMVAGVASHRTSDTVQVSSISKAPGVVGRDLATMHVSSVKVADEPEGTTAHIFPLRQ